MASWRILLCPSIRITKNCRCRNVCIEMFMCIYCRGFPNKNRFACISSTDWHYFQKQFCITMTATVYPRDKFIRIQYWFSDWRLECNIRWQPRVKLIHSISKSLLLWWIVYCPQQILGNERHLQALVYKIRDYYYTERLYLLQCVKVVINLWQDEGHPYKVAMETSTRQSHGTLEFDWRLLSQVMKCLEDA